MKFAIRTAFHASAGGIVIISWKKLTTISVDLKLQSVPDISFDIQLDNYIYVTYLYTTFLTRPERLHMRVSAKSS
jgi:hypothetical protein